MTMEEYQSILSEQVDSNLSEEDFLEPLELMELQDNILYEQPAERR